jgi:hypothetical protein
MPFLGGSRGFCGGPASFPVEEEVLPKGGQLLKVDRGGCTGPATSAAFLPVRLCRGGSLPSSSLMIALIPLLGKPLKVRGKMDRRPHLLVTSHAANVLSGKKRVRKEKRAINLRCLADGWSM